VRNVQDDALKTFVVTPTRASARPGVRRTEGGRGGVGGREEVAAPAPVVERTVERVVEPPSTIDTTASAGSGQVVEEMEGDMWVRRGSLWKRWRRRYASIVSHKFFGRVLCLFSYDPSGAVISTKSEIIVLSSALCRSVRDPLEIGGAEQFVFVLRTAKEYYFAINSDTTRRAWVRELRQAARMAPPSAGAGPAVPGAAPPVVRRQASATTGAGGAQKRAGGEREAAPTGPPTVRRAPGLVSRKSAIGIGRSVTHHGVQQPVTAQSGGIPLTTGRSRRGPFRRPINL
jgi:PH domain